MVRIISYPMVLTASIILASHNPLYLILPAVCLEPVLHNTPAEILGTHSSHQGHGLVSPPARYPSLRWGHRRQDHTLLEHSHRTAPAVSRHWITGTIHPYICTYVGLLVDAMYVCICTLCMYVGLLVDATYVRMYVCT